MAKGKSEVVASGFWSPESVGDMVEGKFLSWHETQFGIAMKLEQKDKRPVMVGMTTVLFNLLKENVNLVRKGVPVRFVYEGKKKRAKIFSAFINGKHLDSSMSFPEASAGAVKDFFSKDYEFKGKGKKRGQKKAKK